MAKLQNRYIAVVATSIDGRIAPEKDYPTNWTSKEDKTFLHRILDDSDLVLVGRRTYEIAKKPLSKRNCLVLTKTAKNFTKRSPNLTFANPSQDLRRYIKDKKYKKIVVLGGMRTYSYCLQKKMLDEIYLTMEPLVFGRGLSIFNLKRWQKVNFRLISAKKLNSKGSLLLHYTLVDYLKV